MKDPVKVMCKAVDSQLLKSVQVVSNKGATLLSVILEKVIQQTLSP